MSRKTPGGQDRKGHLLEDSSNDTRKTGRSDGTTGGQPTIGHLDEESKNAERRVRRFSGAGFASNVALKNDGLLDEGDIESPSKQGDRVGAQPVGPEEK